MAWKAKTRRCSTTGGACAGRGGSAGDSNTDCALDGAGDKCLLKGLRAMESK